MKISVTVNIESPTDYLLAARAAMGCETWGEFLERAEIPRRVYDAMRRATYFTRDEAARLARISGVPVPAKLIEAPACTYKGSSDPFLAARADGCLCDACFTKLVAKDIS